MNNEIQNKQKIDNVSKSMKELMKFNNVKAGMTLVIDWIIMQKFRESLSSIEENYIYWIIFLGFLIPSYAIANFFYIGGKMTKLIKANKIRK